MHIIRVNFVLDALRIWRHQTHVTAASRALSLLQTHVLSVYNTDWASTIPIHC